MKEEDEIVLEIIIGSILVTLWMFIFLIYIPFEIVNIFGLHPLMTLIIGLLFLVLSALIPFYLEYKKEPSKYNLKGFRYIFTGGH